MRGFLSRFGGGKKETIGVLNVKQNEVEFLFFETGDGEIHVTFYGAEQSSRWNSDEILNGVLAQASKQGKVQELVVTFPPDQFRAHMIEETIAPTPTRHIISAKEARMLEEQVHKRVQQTFHKRLFFESGIMPNEFALRKTLAVNRKINGYRVPRLDGYKRGEITFSMLGLFLLEPPFLAVEKAAKRHNVARLRVAHIAEAIAHFANSRQKSGVYLDVGEENTQIAVWKDGEFHFPGVVAVGVGDFVDTLQKEFGLQEATAREFQAEYGQGEFSEETQKRIHSALLPELQKFGTVVKNKLRQAYTSLPAHIWVFGKAGPVQNIEEVFGTLLEEDLPFVGTPTLSALLPEHVWQHANFVGKKNSAYTPLCLLGSLVLRNWHEEKTY